VVEQSAPSEPRITVLIVERDPATRRFLQEFLEEEALTTRALETVGAARAVLNTVFPDVLLLDWRPSGEGPEAILHALQLTPTAPAPAIIVLSTAPPPPTLPHGVVAWLQKPFDSAELLRRVHRHIGRAPT
jgi:DNA-binding response OmpR family regulator